MTPLTAGFIGVGILAIIMFSGMPISIVMFVVGLGGMVYITGWDAAIGILKTVPFRTMASYDMSVIPLFILMGAFCYYAGMSNDLYNTVYKWLGRLRGGLAMATVGACAGFSAVSGSSMATAATMGMVAIPEMKKYGYDNALATGCVAAGGTMGILIPPSIVLAIYAILVEQSIGKMFLAGFLPGILQAIFYMVTIYIVTKHNPLAGPPGPSTTFTEKLVSLKNTWVVILLFVLVIGGIYVGIFSPTEAAGIGAFGALVFGLARRKVTLKNFWSSLLEAGDTAAMVFLILIGAMVFNYFLTVSRLPFQLATIISALPVNRYVIIGIIILIYLFLGTIMSSLAMIILTVPIMYPVIVALGFSPIWFGIIITRMCEIGAITPPVGINVFVIAGIAKDVPMYRIFKGIVPFLYADLVHVILLVAVPGISLLIPSLM